MMISNLSNQNTQPASVGISAVSTFKPPWILPNQWFEGMARKFVRHTGILQRPVSVEDEVSLAIHATENLIRKTGCNMEKCAGLVFTSPSFVPMSVARQYMERERAEKEQLDVAARNFAERMKIQPRQIVASNTYCAGYATALSSVIDELVPTIDLQADEFILVLTSSQISRITDYACRQSSALFGDLSTATLISRMDSANYPVHFELLGACVEEQATNRPFFDFSLRQDVLAPTVDGGQQFDSQRVVFSLDGMGIADTAPRAMASAASEMLEAIELQADDINFIVPHQAGSGIVKFAEMKLRDEGFSADVINGMASEVGNVSSGSVPYTLEKLWQRLSGNILCPIASVGPPGKSAVSQGCIALRSTPIHFSQKRAA